VSLRARIALAAVAAVALGGILAGALLLREIERDGRAALDAQLVDRADRLVGGPRDELRRGGHGPGPRGGPELLAGSGTFVQVAVGGQTLKQEGDVPLDPPAVPDETGYTTVSIAGRDWRSLTLPAGPDDAARLQILATLAPVEERVASIRRLVLLIGLLALLLTGGAAYAFTTVAVRPLGRLREGASRISGADDLARPLPADDGPPEVRSLALALNEMLGRVERAVGATRRFAADAGHELRTPLTGLRANLDTLERNASLPGPQRDAAIAEMSAELDRIVHLLDGLQALARGDAASSLPREPVDLGDVLDAAVYAARRRHPDTDFDLHVHQDAVLDGWPEGVRLLVDNLLDNAALHGGPNVDVRLEADGGGAAITVSDDGEGIAPADRAALVEPFTRGAATTAPGTGLGLAITAQQAALHGGTLVLGDAEAGGLAARIVLPAARNLLTA
jgi:two-component system, OmpR family, sensor histidine kinase PrrB